MVSGWKVVFTTSSEEGQEKWGSGVGSIEDKQGGPGAAMQTWTSRGWPYEYNGSVPGRQYSVRSTYRGNCSGDGSTAGDDFYRII
ncbi:hypothetical protein DPMN_025237 [Dreissena polymorpha]|uniref:Uncharacterized protein n=1 Tax=Dreissena polymorpha TaxID=45954 RepID=A0A9D4LSX9_DREPO|nr:hypothetical protein DPMN_025237 [Dreissena polymorpha]